MRIQRSIEIAAPPEKIWPFLVEPENILKVIDHVERFEYAGEQRSGVGTAYYCEERASGQLMKRSFVATEWVENERLSLSMTSGDFVKAHEETWTIKAIPSGSRLTFEEQIEFPYGIFGKVIEVFGQRQAEVAVEEMLAKLKRLAEAQEV